jgi:hypothetical protein
MKDGFAELKAQVESLYPCLGITCADVGEFQNTAGVYTGAEACEDNKDEEDDDECEDWTNTEKTTEAPGTEAPATEAPATEAPGTTAPAQTTAEPTEPAVLDSMAYPFAALSGIVFLVNA